MIRAGVLSAEDQFHRDVRRHAADAGVRVDLVLRSVTELRTSGGLDVVIVHRPSADDLEFVQEVVGSLPIVVAGPGAIHDLTSREQEVLRLVGGGATNHEVAAQLAISDNTVKYHLGSLYSKLGVSRRSEVIFEAIRRGLITV